MLLGDTNVCERPVVVQRGSHELNSESVTPVYCKAQRQHENKRKLIAPVIKATQLGNIYLMLLGDTNVCERPIVDQCGSHELNSESVTPVYCKAQKKWAT